MEAKAWSVATNHKLLETEDAEVDLLGWNWTYPTELLIVESLRVPKRMTPSQKPHAYDPRSESDKGLTNSRATIGS